MANFRKERMAESIRKVVSEKIAREGASLMGAVVTINRVDLAPDYSHAKVFYSVFGSSLAENEIVRLMKDLVGDFRFEISQKLNFRKTPRLQFCYDRNTEHAFRIDSLLKTKEDEESF